MASPRPSDCPSVRILGFRAYIGNPWEIYSHIANTYCSGGVDVPFGVMTFDPQLSAKITVFTLLLLISGKPVGEGFALKNINCNKCDMPHINLANRHRYLDHYYKTRCAVSVRDMP